METKTKTKNKLLESALWYGRHGWHVIPLNEPLFDKVDSQGTATTCTCDDFWRYKGTKKKPADPAYECSAPGKHPRIARWEEQASTSEEQIRKWWRRWPNANIGVAAGKSGLVVIDIDTYNEVADGGALELSDRNTITSLTGGGGEHLVYEHPPGLKIRNSDASLPDWVNIRAHGGQFVVPPSLHKSGRHYEWEDGFGPHEFQHD